MYFTLDQMGLLVRSRYTILYLLTHEERRVERKLLRLGKSEGLDIYRWRTTNGTTDPAGQSMAGTQTPASALRQILEVPAPSLFLLYDFHWALKDPEVIRLLRDLDRVLATRTQAIVIISPVAAIPTELEKDTTIIDVPLPDPDEVGSLLDDMAATNGIFVHPDAREQLVRAALGLSETEIRRAISRILLSGGQLTEDDVPHLLDEKRRAIRASRYLEFYDMVERMDQVGGMDNLKLWLAQRARAFSQEAQDFGLPTPRGLFLLGVQGCGKSLMAKAVAHYWRVPLLRLDVGSVFQVRDRAEQSLRETIHVAESLAPTVLWIDELEKGFLSTQETGGARALGTFLTWMQEKTRPIFVVATANDVRMLPPELLRKGRFDDIFFVDLPNVHERLAILEIHLQRRKRNPELFDLTQVAEESERFSGAELEQAVAAALFDAFAKGREVTADDILNVVRETIPLAITMDDRLKELREWARPRARPASLDTRRIDYFEEWQER